MYNQIYLPTWQNIPEDVNTQPHRWHNLKSRIITFRVCDYPRGLVVSASDYWSGSIPGSKMGIFPW
jgi:hypothetical protein